MDAEFVPRVRILCAGEVFREQRFCRRFRSWLRSDSWVSPKRKYVFIISSQPDLIPDEDPSQPVVGTIVALSHRALGATNDTAFALWSHTAMPPPLLWIVGDQRESSADELIVAQRELLQRYGIRADESPTICTRSLCEATLDQLVQALDEHFDDGAEIRHNPMAPVLAAEELLKMYRLKNIQSVDDPTTEHRIALACSFLSPQSEALLRELSALFAASGEWECAGKILATNVIQSKTVLTEWLEGVLRSCTALPNTFAMVCWWLQEQGGAVPTSMMLDRKRSKLAQYHWHQNLPAVVTVILNHGSFADLETLRALLLEDHFLPKTKKNTWVRGIEWRVRERSGGKIRGTKPDLTNTSGKR